MSTSKWYGVTYKEDKKNVQTAIENFKNGKPRAEASFLKGKRDGVARYWHENGILKLEEQWFDGKEDGLFREWDDEGQLLKALRYKRGELIEVLKN